MSEEKAQFKHANLMNIQGKAYLPVAPRVVIFRADHGLEYGIETAHATIEGKSYMRAKVVRLTDGAIIASASKRVKEDARGPAKDWPIETAETGAIGRALALCGYGTMTGDLDEGDQLSDAPVGNQTDKDGRPSASATPQSDPPSMSDTEEVVM